MYAEASKPLTRLTGRMGSSFAVIFCFFLLSATARAQLVPLMDVAQVEAGSTHTCALTSGGGVKCWGSNVNGQLGDGTTTQRLVPVDVSGLGSGVQAISAGMDHTCALTTGGGVKCWGWNFNGRLGDGSTDNTRLTPVDVIGLSNGVIAISAGDRHTCALTTGGGVKCWGANHAGQLGEGSTTERLTQVDVVGLGSGVTEISAGDFHNCALTTVGAVKCWGSNTFGQLGDGSTTSRLTQVEVFGLGSGVIEISAGSNHTCALTTSGGLKCWGYNLDGQLGDGVPLIDGTFEREQLLPVNVQGLGDGVTAVSAGVAHTCALTTGAGVKCWGANFVGQLGDGTTTGHRTQVDVASLTVGVLRISAGEFHTCALTQGGGVKCWGDVSQGQLGDGSIGNRIVPGGVASLSSGVASVSAGNTHACALTTGGGVKCWGENQAGQLGDGSLTSRLTPVDVTGLSSGVTAISVGYGHSCALTSGGGVKCWGYNFSGELGDGSTVNRLTPVDVLGLGAGVTAISEGGAFTCALTTGGGVKCWGGNYTGTLGDGGFSNRPTPGDVTGLTSGVAAISSGVSHTCALTTSGGVKCWGSNDEGQLGDGSVTLRSSPVDVSGLTTGVAAISAGLAHTCALTTGGGVKCWAGNSYGQIGDGSNFLRWTPVDVLGLTSDVASISAGFGYTCALTTGGGMKCWGRNDYGQLGDGRTVNQLTSVDVSGLVSDVAAISAGSLHACALSIDGALRCWGSDIYGQLGDAGRGYTLPGDVLFDPNRTRLSSPSFTPSNANGASKNSVSDGSGRYIVFQSAANNVTGQPDNNGADDIFRYDIQTGTTVRVSLDDTGNVTTGASIEPSVSGDGQFVAFVAPDRAVPKVRNETKAQREKRSKASGQAVFLRNLVSNSTFRVGGALPTGAGTLPQLAPNGMSVVITAPNTDPALGVLGQSNVVSIPLAIEGGERVPKPDQMRCVTCKSVSTTGTPVGDSNGPSYNATVSADGQWIAFETMAKNLLAADPSPCAGSATPEVYLRNLISGASQRISPSASITPLNCGTAGSRKPSMDWAGGKIVLESDQPITPLDRNGDSDVYFFDLTTGGAERISQDPRTGHDGLSVSVKPRISGNGKQVAFVSEATNMESSEADNNETGDVVVYAVERKVARRVSNNRRNDQSNRYADRPHVNYDGSYVLFESNSDNLLVSPQTGQLLDDNNATDIFRAISPHITRGGPETIQLDGFEER